MRDETESGLIQPIGGEDPKIGLEGGERDRSLVMKLLGDRFVTSSANPVKRERCAQV